jgi:hypothetical protein
MTLRRDRGLADGGAKPRPSGLLPGTSFVARNHGKPLIGTFGAASKVRRLTADERRAVEANLRDRGILRP